MYSRILLFTGALVSTIPLNSAAQTAPNTTASTLYVGLGASYTRYGSPTRIGPTLTIGLPLTPRLAVQTGASLYWRKMSFFGSYYDPFTNQYVPDVSMTTYDRLLAVPIVARYTITPLTGRFHLDLVAGATALYYFGHYTRTSPAQSQGMQLDERDSYNQFTGVLSLGPSLRYVFTAHVDLVGDFLLNTSWERNTYTYHRTYPGSITVGARYYFAR